MASISAAGTLSVGKVTKSSKRTDSDATRAELKLDYLGSTLARARQVLNEPMPEVEYFKARLVLNFQVWPRPPKLPKCVRKPAMTRLLCRIPEESSSFFDRRAVFKRRDVLRFSSVGLLSSVFWDTSSKDGVAVASEFADMPALRGKDYGKTKMRYPDYTETDSGLQYKDLRVGSGPIPKVGDTVVVDWDGYTIGYYGRIFEARNKTKGGSFEGDDKDFYKFRVGSQQVIPAFEEAIAGMALGGIRRLVVPPELGYPDNDYNKSGPRPTTFSGQRALDFVLRNQGLIDKTLLFDIELLKIIPN